MQLNFNEQQKKAIEFYTGACAVIAGAGSGKSSVLVNRINNLAKVHKVNQSDILAISFTKNTAIDLKKKLSDMKLDNVNVGTFHSICARILLNHDIEVSDSNKIKEWQVEKCLKSIDDSVNVKDVMDFISYQKNYLRNPADEFMYKESKYSEEQLRKFYKEYEKFKNKNGLYDFDDWLIQCHELLKVVDVSYGFVLVDEHQDSNLVQNLILKQLCKSGNIFCVFDFRQAIYTFRGGNPEYCMNFDKEWRNATIINLDMNYRSNNNIVDYANGFIKKYYGGYEHYSDSIANNKKDGQIDILSYGDRYEEGIEVVNKIEKLLAEGEHPEEIAVLYRIKSQSGNIENELKKRGIEYDITNDSSFFKRKEIESILGYLKLIHNQHDDQAFDQVFKIRNYPLAFFSNDTYKAIKVYAAKNNLSAYEAFISYKFNKNWEKVNANIFRDNITRLKLQYDKGIDIGKLIDNVITMFKFDDFLQEKYSDEDDLQERKDSISTLKLFIKGDNIGQFIKYIDSVNNNKKKKQNVIKLMTIHSSKGLEFKHVFIIGIEDGKFPHNKSDILDEARLFYVGVTRPKENLYLSQIYEGNRFVSEYMVS